ncbi:hypothetical protein NLM59_01590 [Weeksellaceae bacterium KMM 9724]|uniref:hypothetical protein n=1 Tax=Profundicola chukchiensis TaxID=2961959 RepID=UPI00243ED7A2|nr:hypothetical protein [Profundicola chukchiensis]MDG4949604.1 hypothetical protein [Profundicola chukchiensis]
MRKTNFLTNNLFLLLLLFNLSNLSSQEFQNGNQFQETNTSNNYCVSGCNSNSFLNSSDPNTIEYDNIVGLYHSTMLKETDGNLKVWGASAAANGNDQLTPILVTPGNGYTYSGQILKFTGGASNGKYAQFTLLTTDGLYFWGQPDVLISNDIKSDTQFQKVTTIGTAGEGSTSQYGLPLGVAPQDVKMMFGTYKTLAIVTCSGEAWVLSRNQKVFGDGGSNITKWHRVQTSESTPLINVVALRGSTSALMALTSDNKIYTWGENAYLGDAKKGKDRTYAKEMTKPSGVIKQIGMTGGNSYYILMANGDLFALGENSDQELGIFNMEAQKNWVRVKKTNTALLSNIAWISPNEHSAGDGSKGYGAINVLTTAGELWSWGRDSSQMLGGGGHSISPSYMVGGLSNGDNIMAVETGGHTTMVIKQCSFKFGYLGHKVLGSMGDGIATSSAVSTFNFTNTAEISLCGAPTGPNVVGEFEVCQESNETVDLTTAHIGDIPNGLGLVWYTTEDQQPGTEVQDATQVGAGVYYAFYSESPCEVLIPTKVTVKEIDCTPNQGYCVTGCNDNTFLNSTDPNTLEYDNIVGLYHSTMLKETDGTLKVWGASASATGNHQLVPVLVKPENGYNYNGEILKFTGGAINGDNAQFTILTTDGLYFWGIEGVLVSSNIKAGLQFQKANAIGTAGQSGTSNYSLPIGVMPRDVKMMFGTHKTLAIVTCSGEAWVLSQKNTLYGDGSSSGNNVWHRVSTYSGIPLKNVVALRGSTSALMALTADNKIYTWGENVYLGYGSGISNETYAKEMKRPSADKTIKQIGMTSGNSYYALMTDGYLYALGENNNRELGIFNTNNQNNWVQVKKANSNNDFLMDIAWISPNEHSAGDGSKGYGAINALTFSGKLWSWGRNSHDMLGSGGSSINPSLMVGGLTESDNIMAVETGGHTTMVIKQCSFKFGYLGHKTRGSMADGSYQSADVPEFNFSNTAEISLCGAPTGPNVIGEFEICQYSDGTVNLSDAHIGDLPSGVNLVWYTTEDHQAGTEVEDPTQVGAGVYYAFYSPSQCEDWIPTKVTVKEIDCFCTEAPNIGVVEGNTKIGISTFDRDVADTSWAEGVQNGFIKLESKNLGFVPTRLNSTERDSLNAEEGMMIWNIDTQCLEFYNGTIWVCSKNKCNR